MPAVPGLNGPNAARFRVQGAKLEGCRRDRDSATTAEPLPPVLFECVKEYVGVLGNKASSRMKASETRGVSADPMKYIQLYRAALLKSGYAAASWRSGKASSKTLGCEPQSQQGAEMEQQQIVNSNANV
ncbi:hypothetical protein Emed_007446 [Eimeria media]